MRRCDQGSHSNGGYGMARPPPPPPLAPPPGFDPRANYFPFQVDGPPGIFHGMGPPGMSPAPPHLSHANAETWPATVGLRPPPVPPQALPLLAGPCPPPPQALASQLNSAQQHAQHSSPQHVSATSNKQAIQLNSSLAAFSTQQHNPSYPQSPPIQPNLELIEERASHARAAAAALVDGDVMTCLSAASAAAAAGLPLPDMVVADAIMLACSMGGSILAKALRVACPSEESLRDAATIDAKSRAHKEVKQKKQEERAGQRSDQKGLLVPQRELSSRPELRLGAAVLARALRRMVHEWPRDRTTEVRALCNLALVAGSEPLPLRFTPYAACEDALLDEEMEENLSDEKDAIAVEAPPCWQQLEATAEVALGNRVLPSDGKASTAAYFGHFCALVHSEHLRSAETLRARFEGNASTFGGSALERKGLAAVALEVKSMVRMGDGGMLKITLQHPGGSKGLSQDKGQGMGKGQGRSFSHFRLKRNETVLLSSLRGSTYEPLGCGELASVSPAQFTFHVQPGAAADAVVQKVDNVRDGISKGSAAVFRLDAAPDFTSYDRAFDALLALCSAGEETGNAAITNRHHRPALFDIITSTPVSPSTIALAAAPPGIVNDGSDDDAENQDKVHSSSDGGDGGGNGGGDGGDDDGGVLGSGDEIDSPGSDAAAPPPAIEEMAAADAGRLPARLLEAADEDLAGLMAAGTLSSAQGAAVRGALSRNLTIIQGPPGTGKTTVSVQILRLWTEVLGLRPVLATAQNNVAVNNMCDGLRAVCGSGLKIVRIGAAEKVGAVEDAASSCSLDALVDRRLRKEAGDATLRGQSDAISAELEVFGGGLAAMSLEALRKQASVGMEPTAGAQANGIAPATTGSPQGLNDRTPSPAEEGASSQDLTAGTSSVTAGGSKSAAGLEPWHEECGSEADDDAIERTALIRLLVALKRAELEAGARVAGEETLEQEATGQSAPRRFKGKGQATANQRDVEAGVGGREVGGDGGDGGDRGAGQRAYRRKVIEARNAVLREADVVFAQLITAGGRLLRACGPFEGILIDEVAQATELAAVVPVALRLGLSGEHGGHGASSRGCRLVLAGDHCQLPPTTSSREAERRGLGVSLYARLVVCGGVRPHFLDVQHRQHPLLAAFSSTHFYGSKLRTSSAMEASRPPPVIGLPWPADGLGLVLLDTTEITTEADDRKADSNGHYEGKGTSDGKGYGNGKGFGKLKGHGRSNFRYREEGDGCGSKLNRAEAALVVKVVVEALDAGELTAKDVGIVTPYSAQVRCLREAWAEAVTERKKRAPSSSSPPSSSLLLSSSLSSSSSSPSSSSSSSGDTLPQSHWAASVVLRELEIGSVDAFQGREKELIVFSAVRANSGGDVGFLGDWRRLNVMLTRPKRGLVVVGHAETLRCDPHWRRWVGFAEKQGCLVSRTAWDDRARGAAAFCAQRLAEASSAHASGDAKCSAELCRRLGSRPWGPAAGAGEDAFAAFVAFARRDSGGAIDDSGFGGGAASNAGTILAAWAAFSGKKLAAGLPSSSTAETSASSGGPISTKKKRKKFKNSSEEDPCLEVKEPGGLSSREAAGGSSGVASARSVDVHGSPEKEPKKAKKVQRQDREPPAARDASLAESGAYGAGGGLHKAAAAAGQEEANMKKKRKRKLKKERREQEGGAGGAEAALR